MSDVDSRPSDGGWDRSPTTPLHVWHGGADDDPISTTVVTAVAKAADEPATELPPLYDWIDPDALDALFRVGFEGYLAFTYEEFGVTVYDDGEITVRRLTE